MDNFNFWNEYLYSGEMYKWKNIVIYPPIKSAYLLFHFDTP